MNSGLAIRVLGQPEFSYEGSRFRLTASRRALALLGFLTLKRRAPVSRGSVLLAIWPDDDEAAARTALRRELHRLLRALPEVAEPWILSDAYEMQWNERAPLWFDLAEFEREVTTPGGERRAVELYRGDLLDGLDDEWVFPERERLRVAHAEALGKLLAAARSVRDFEAAIGYAGRILSADPFREDIVRALISVRYESGDRAGALHEAERYAQLYRKELGVGLMPETEALRFAMSRAEALDESAPPVAARPAPRGSAPAFTGRAVALEKAIGLWQRAMRGACTTLFISGEAGIGKSRLVEELARVAERQGGRVLVGTSSHPERVPYEAISTALENAIPLLASVRAEPAMRRSLERIVPSLAPEGAVPERAAASELASQRARLFDALTHHVAALARARPLLLVFEDVHWARPSTLAAVRAIATAAPGARVLVVVTLRTEAIGDALAALRHELVASDVATNLPLARLSPGDTRALARSVEAAQTFDDAALERLVRFSEGNPLLLVEGLAALARDGAALPATSGALAELIGDRVAALDEATADVADVAANIGERFTLDTLGAVCGLDEATLLDAVGRLIEGRFLAEAKGRTPFDYAFTHHLIRAALYDRIPAAVRKRRHRLIARILEGRGRVPGNASDVAAHYEAAGAPAEAARWYLAAARDALDAYANDEAGALLEAALAFARDPALRFAALDMRRALRARRGDEAAMAEDFQAMAELARALDDAPRFRVLECRAEIAMREGNLGAAAAAIDALERHPHAGRRKGAIALARTRLAVKRDSQDDVIAAARAALAGCDDATPASDRVELLCHLSRALQFRGEFDEAGAALARVIEIGSAQDANASLIFHANLEVARSAYLRHQQEDADRFASAALEAARVVGDREAIASAFGLRAAIRRTLRRLTQARADIDAAIELRGSRDSKGDLPRLLLYSAMVDVDCGELHRADATADRVIALASDEPAIAADAHNVKSVALGLLGENVRALESARRSLEHFVAIGNRVHEGYSLNNIGSLEGECGDVAAGLLHVRQSIELLTPMFREREKLAVNYGELALLLVRSGDTEAAHPVAVELLDLPAGIAGFTWGHVMFLMLFKVFRACGDRERCALALARAGDLLAAHFEVVPEESRERFLAVPIHRELRAEIARAGLSETLAELPE